MQDLVQIEEASTSSQEAEDDTAALIEQLNLAQSKNMSVQKRLKDLMSTMWNIKNRWLAKTYNI